jgi:glutamate racemase
MEMGPNVVLVSSAEETAKDVYAELVRGDRLREDREAPVHAFMTTGEAEPFHRLAELFLGHELEGVDAVHVEAGVEA